MYRNLCPLVIVSVGLFGRVRAGEPNPEAKLARPTPAQLAWQDMELEMFVCLDPCTWQDRDYDNHSTPLEQINPTKLDTDQWCRVAKSWGAGQILFVAKHTGGFCWWQTETSAYSVKNTPWRGGKGDVLADLSRSCKKFDLKLAIYVYPGDDNWGAYIGGGGRTRDPNKQEAYNKVFRQQMTEVLSRYGPVAEVWFDGSCVIPVGDILKKYVPNAVILQSPHASLRWVGNEAGWAPYPAWNSVKSVDGKTGVSTAAHGDPGGDMWMPLEVDTVNVHPHWWFWKSKGRRLKSVDELMRHYYESVGRGAVLLLNSTPDTTGLIPEEDVAQYAAFGAEIRRRFGQSLAETAGEGDLVELAFEQPTSVNHVISMEDIRHGERVREYALEGLVDGTWQSLVEGISIGHKRIDHFPSLRVEKIRLRVTKAAAKPLIRRLAVYDVSGVFPDRMTGAVWNFDEGEGDQTRDRSGESVGKISGAAWGEGRRGKALEFDGVDDYVALGSADVYDRDFTVAAWIRPRSFPATGGTIVAKERNSLADDNLRLYVLPDGKLGFWITDRQRNNIWPFETSAGTITPGEWTHVAATRRGTEHAMFVNGKRVGVKSSEVVIRHCSRLAWRVGGRYPPGGNDAVGDYPFDGAIDDVRFYMRALSEKELANPDALPDPDDARSGWCKVADWSASADWRTLRIDLSAHIPVAGQYEVVLHKTGGSGELETRSIVLILEGQPTPGFATPLDRSGALNVNRTAAPTGRDESTVLEIDVRGRANKTCYGAIRIRGRR